MKVNEWVWWIILVALMLLVVLVMTGCSTSGGTTTANQTIVSLIYVGDADRKDEDCITDNPAD